MRNLIRLPQLAWYEPKDLELHLPDRWQVEVCNMAGYNRPAMTDEQIGDAITNLKGLLPIRQLAKGKHEVVIIFDDICRVTRVAKIIPFVLQELAEAGIPDHKIRFVAATGTHAAMDRIGFSKKLGEATMARFPVYNHNPFLNCTYVGTTSYGTKVSVNAEVMKCDFKIALGSITPHMFTVFSGGGKIILPGVCSVETIMANHKLPVADKKNYETHAIRLDMEEAANLAGIDVNIECLVNLWGDTVSIFAGPPIPSHAAGVLEATSHYLTPKAVARDIVIANTYAKVNEAAVGALFASPSVKENGGDLVLICNAPQGQVVHYLFGCWGTTLGGYLGKIPVPIPSYVNHVIVYTEYPDIPGLGYFEQPDKVLMMANWDDVLRTLQDLHRGEATVSVYPNADIQYFG
jgi:nickel-dependent lactate racemase